MRRRLKPLLIFAAVSILSLTVAYPFWLGVTRRQSVHLTAQVDKPGAVSIGGDSFWTFDSVDSAEFRATPPDIPPTTLLLCPALSSFWDGLSSGWRTTQSSIVHQGQNERVENLQASSFQAKAKRPIFMMAALSREGVRFQLLPSKSEIMVSQPSTELVVIPITFSLNDTSINANDIELTADGQPEFGVTTLGEASDCGHLRAALVTTVLPVTVLFSGENVAGAGANVHDVSLQTGGMTVMTLGDRQTKYDGSLELEMSGDFSFVEVTGDSMRVAGNATSVKVNGSEHVPLLLYRYLPKSVVTAPVLLAWTLLTALLTTVMTSWWTSKTRSRP